MVGRIRGPLSRVEYVFAKVQSRGNLQSRETWEWTPAHVPGEGLIHDYLCASAFGFLEVPIHEVVGRGFVESLRLAHQANGFRGARWDANAAPYATILLDLVSVVFFGNCLHRTSFIRAYAASSTRFLIYFGVIVALCHKVRCVILLHAPEHAAAA